MQLQGSSILIRHASAWLWYCLALLSTLNAHSGYHFPFFPSPEAHDFHHLKFNQCYGVLGILDYLHGTDTLFRSNKVWRYFPSNKEVFDKGSASLHWNLVQLSVQTQRAVFNCPSACDQICWFHCFNLVTLRSAYLEIPNYPPPKKMQWSFFKILGKNLKNEIYACNYEILTTVF